MSPNLELKRSKHWVGCRGVAVVGAGEDRGQLSVVAASRPYRKPAAGSATVGTAVLGAAYWAKSIRHLRQHYHIQWSYREFCNNISHFTSAVLFYLLFQRRKSYYNGCQKGALGNYMCHVWLKPPLCGVMWGKKILNNDVDFLRQMKWKMNPFATRISFIFI